MYRKIGLALLAIFVSASPVLAAEVQQPQIDVVFALDTTGSMGGLIQGAKEKIWSVASTTAQGKSSPKIRIGLLAYRDRGDAYVTTKFPLTEDLDAMYSKLMSFSADGGGDGPESVNQALKESVDDFDWSKDPKTYRVVFLVGDAPPHMDYQSDVPYATTIKTALQRGIVLNTIQCGGDTSTKEIWQEIALKGEGKFIQVDQNGSVASITTPYDERLAKLSGELEGTRMYYGDSKSKADAMSRDSVAKGIAAAAPVTASASRTIWNASKAGEKNFLGENELVNKIERGELELSSVKEADLPQELQAVAPEKRREIVQQKIESRKKLQEEVAKLSQQRQDFLSEALKKTGKDKDVLDEKLYSAIKEQAEKKGITYESGPRY